MCEPVIVVNFGYCTRKREDHPKGGEGHKGKRKADSLFTS
jgi:hypothetical protein